MFSTDFYARAKYDKVSAAAANSSEVKKERF